MISSVIRQLLSIGLVVLVSTAVTAWATLAFADKDCDKNEDKNCSHSERNQNSSPKINCEIHIDAEDHLNNNDFGPNEQQCLNNSNNIKDSTVLLNPPPNGGTGSSDGNIELNPTSGPFDTSVSVSGTNFAPNSNVIITFGLIQQQIRETDNNGDFDADFTVLQTVPGPLTVTASDGSSSDQATFTVTSSPPENPVIGLNDTSGPVGTPVNIIGINFDPDSEVTITFSGNGTVTTATTSSLGVFSANFTVPTSTIGQHTVTATDEGSNSDSTIFTVTASAPLSTTERLASEPNVVGKTPSSSNLSEKTILPDIFA